MEDFGDIPRFFFGIFSILGAIVLLGLVSFGFGCVKVNDCVEECRDGYKYLVCQDTGVVQMMSGDGEQIYLVKCNNENQN